MVRIFIKRLSNGKSDEKQRGKLLPLNFLGSLLQWHKLQQPKPRRVWTRCANK